MAKSKSEPKPGKVAYRYVGGPEDSKPLPVITIGDVEINPGDIVKASEDVEDDPRFVRCLDTSE